MTGMSDPLAGGFVGKSQVDAVAIPAPTPEMVHAAALTIVEHSTSIADARELLTMVGLR
jgi:hypothetical protein